MNIFGLFSVKIVAIVAAVVIAGVGAWGGYQYVKLQKATADVAKMQRERDEAAAQRDKAIEANRTNIAVIEQLKQEKRDVEQSLADLSADKKKNQQVISNLAAAIRATANDPANKVELSPVLKSTVSAIQKQRETRGGAK